MPYYEYFCDKCERHFAETKSIEDRHSVDHCGQRATKLVSLPSGVQIDASIKDSKGSPIWFPKVGGYYDKALQQTFETKKQKANYLKEKGLQMDGSTTSMSKRKSADAGTTRKSAPIYST